MAPLLIASLLGGAALGGMKAKRQQAQADQQNKFRKAAIMYSPWTGMSDPGGATAPSDLEGLLGGALTGAQVGGALQGLGIGAEEAVASAPTGMLPIATTGGQNYLGLSQNTLQGMMPQENPFSIGNPFELNKYSMLAARP